MHMPSYLEQEEFLTTLAHDLRQPLGAIQTSACYLNLLLGPGHGPAHEQVRLIERQVDCASHILNEAAGELRRLRAQRADTAESLALTKSEIAAVT